MWSGAVKKNLILQVRALLVLLTFLFFFQYCQNNNGYRVLDTPVSVVDNLNNNREYRLYLPDTKQETPLLVYFHGVMSKGFKDNPALKGYTGSPVGETGLIKFCKLNKITLLVPKAYYKNKFQHYNVYGWSPFSKEIDGIEKIIDVVIKNYNINKKEIYLSGISAGAVLINHLANRRPDLYNSILSHSQGFTTEDDKLLQPSKKGPKFGVVICYTSGDYKNLKYNCNETYNIYKSNDYKTIILKDLSPKDHSWDRGSNKRFWKYLRKVGQYTGASK